MKEMLRMILDMDKQACERVKEAEAYRDKEIAELGEKKNRITYGHMSADRLFFVRGKQPECRGRRTKPGASGAEPGSAGRDRQAGQLSVRLTDQIFINGNVYDDWHIAPTRP